MKKTSKIILMSVLTIVACVSLISGATFALFTSESSVNIAVTSGKVQVSATAEIVSAWSAKYVDGAYVKDTELDFDGSVYTFTTGGTASMADNTVTLTGIVPGDGVQVKVTIANNSNVAIRYKVMVNKGVSSGSYAGGGLFDELSRVVSTDADGAQPLVSEWKTALANEDIDDLYVSVELPIDADNTYQEQFCTLVITVQAVQGNANVTEFTGGRLDNMLGEGTAPSVELQTNTNTAADFRLKQNQTSQTLDLNGHIFRGSFHNFGFDSSVSYDHDADIYIRNGTIVSDSVNLNKDQPYGYGIALWGVSAQSDSTATVTLHLDNVHIYGSHAAFSTNGQNKGIKVIANNCTFEGKELGAYLPADAEYEFNNCRFVGQSGICVRSGKVTLNNCTIEATECEVAQDFTYFPSGAFGRNGSALIIAGGSDSSYSDLYLTINGGTLVSALRYGIEDCCGLPTSESGSGSSICKIKSLIVKNVTVKCKLGSIKRYTEHATDGWVLPEGWL